MPEPDRSAETKRRGPSPRLVVGLVLLLGALAAGGWLIWLYGMSGKVVRYHLPTRIVEVWRHWEAEPAADLVAAPQPGEAYWLIRIPRLGGWWEWPVAVGVGDDVIGETVGWYPGTAQPGQVGNFAVAGQCITGAQPFRHLRELEVGDVVEVEGATAIHTYTIVSAPADLTVASDDSWVLDPVPGRDDVPATEALITLTTCEDLYPTPDRSVGFGVLTDTEEK